MNKELNCYTLPSAHRSRVPCCLHHVLLPLPASVRQLLSPGPLPVLVFLASSLTCATEASLPAGRGRGICAGPSGGGFHFLHLAGQEHLCLSGHVLEWWADGGLWLGYFNTNHPLARRETKNFLSFAAKLSKPNSFFFIGYVAF